MLAQHKCWQPDCAVQLLLSDTPMTPQQSARVLHIATILQLQTCSVRHEEQGLITLTSLQGVPESESTRMRAVLILHCTSSCSPQPLWCSVARPRGARASSVMLDHITRCNLSESRTRTRSTTLAWVYASCKAGQPGQFGDSH